MAGFPGACWRVHHSSRLRHFRRLRPHGQGATSLAGLPAHAAVEINGPHGWVGNRRLDFFAMGVSPDAEVLVDRCRGARLSWCDEAGHFAGWGLGHSAHVMGRADLRSQGLSSPLARQIPSGLGCCGGLAAHSATQLVRLPSRCRHITSRPPASCFDIFKPKPKPKPKLKLKLKLKPEPEPEPELELKLKLKSSGSTVPRFLRPASATRILLLPSFPGRCRLAKPPSPEFPSGGSGASPLPLLPASVSKWGGGRMPRGQ